MNSSLVPVKLLGNLGMHPNESFKEETRNDQEKLSEPVKTIRFGYRSFTVNL